MEEGRRFEFEEKRDKGRRQGHGNGDSSFGSAVGGFTGASFRERTDDFGPSENKKKTEKISARPMIRGISFLIYELNKFATTPSLATTEECEAKMEDMAHIVFLRHRIILT